MIIAFGLTIGVVLALTIYAMFTKTRMYTWASIVIVCFIAGLGLIILGTIIKNRWLHISLACIAVLIFGIYIVIDTQHIIGKNSAKYSIDDYVKAACRLYTDVIKLFLAILVIVGIAGKGRR